MQIGRWVVSLIAIAGAVGLLAYRATWHNLPWQGDPARLSLCGRDYDPAPGQVKRGSDLNGAAVHVEYRVPWLIGRAVLSTRTVEERRHPPLPGGACAGHLYLRVGPDRYKDYELSGGP
jgi:hypothetical protein